MKLKPLVIQVSLLIVTFITTTLAGAEWRYGRYLFLSDAKMTFDDFVGGLWFSIPFLTILTFHEFGHYFVARFHKIRVTLPYYIPLWFGFLPLPSFGTMGAFIRIKSRIASRKHYFDVGIAGPLAGFVIALGVIWYGFTHLPDPEFIFDVHPEYAQYGLDYAQHVYNDEQGISFQFGGNLLFWFFENYVVTDPSRLPHPNEVIHYPLLLAGYLALFFTAINLLPVGQLDGGHVIFGLIGPAKARWLNRIFYLSFLFYAGLGVISLDMVAESSGNEMIFFVLILVAYLYFLTVCLSSVIELKRDRWMVAAVLLAVQFFITTLFKIEGYQGWLLFAFLVGRVIGVYHPPVRDNTQLNMPRKILGWVAVVVFIISFSPKPFIIG